MDEHRFSESPEEYQRKFVEVAESISSKIVDAEISSGYMYIRHLVFMNGGALVAVLTAAKPHNDAWLWPPMACFCLGLVLAVMINGSVYLRFMDLSRKHNKLTQDYSADRISRVKFDEECGNLNERHNNWICWENVSGGLGLLSFIVGAILGIWNLV